MRGKAANQALTQDLVPQQEAQLADLQQQCRDTIEERDQLGAELAGLQAERTALRQEVQALRRTLLAVVQGEEAHHD
jgi:uncharacterized coiled-coil DUF342 family protein